MKYIICVVNILSEHGVIKDGFNLTFDIAVYQEQLSFVAQIEMSKHVVRQI